MGRGRRRYDTRTTVERGYGQAHRQLRDQWRPEVDAGRVYCHAPVCVMGDRWIAPGTEWHLGHTPDRSEWTGPEHARCNLSEAGKRGNPKGLPKPQPAVRVIAPWRPTRRW